MDDVGAFYDGLADTYDLIYEDWDASIRRQGSALDGVVTELLGPGPHRILDCACGIGTQVLGLLGHGHDLTGSDLSPSAVTRARTEVTRRGQASRLAAADMRALPFSTGAFDVVVCADNSLAHLLHYDEVAAAVTAMARVTRPGGVVAVSIRAYDALRAQRPRSTAPSYRNTESGRTITFQLWDWHDDGERYDVSLFQLTPAGDGWTLARHVTTCWAMSRATIDAALQAGGWDEVTWHEPADSGFFQPLVTARRR